MLLRQLQTFHEAARSGNFSDAARKLHLTQSAVSHQVKTLEEIMGLKLYERHRRGIVLTDQGREILSYIEKILAHVRDMDECVNALRGGFLGNISVAAHRGVIRYKIPKVVKLFKKSYPTMGILLSTRPVDDEIMGMVTSGSVDFGVVTSWSDHGDLQYHEFLSYDMYVCIPPKHPFARRKPEHPDLTLEDLAGEPLLLYEPATSVRKHIDKVFAKEDLTCNPVVETGGAMTLREYAKAGLGAAIVSGMSFEDEPDPDMAWINVTHLFGKLGYGFVYRKDKFFTTALLDFINLLDPHFSLDGKLA
jgi:LysR family cys regulon transcriptional activator